mmetsp:Transcript_69665/g.202173  ORF Transcript_69665/g.202173 Transcript_69665/m.202173 type:complete len:226 (-) Transcript_69665:1303-1980(-)
MKAPASGASPTGVLPGGSSPLRPLPASARRNCSASCWLTACSSNVCDAHASRAMSSSPPTPVSTGVGGSLGAPPPSTVPLATSSVAQPSLSTSSRCRTPGSALLKKFEFFGPCKIDTRSRLGLGFAVLLKSAFCSAALTAEFLAAFSAAAASRAAASSTSTASGLDCRAARARVGCCGGSNEWSPPEVPSSMPTTCLTVPERECRPPRRFVGLAQVWAEPPPEAA